MQSSPDLQREDVVPSIKRHSRAFFRNIPLKDLQCEFPNLYGDNLSKIITENIKKDE